MIPLLLFLVVQLQQWNSLFNFQHRLEMFGLSSLEADEAHSFP